jgi:hypothetical protein
MPFVTFVFPTSVIVIPSPCRTITTSGNASLPWETRYTGPIRGLVKIGVIASALPTTDATGQVAGFASKVAAKQAFCSVVRRAGSCLGKSTLTDLMFA